MSFDLSSIPAGSIISSATLTLKESNSHGFTRTIAVHRVTHSWTEGGVTWNSRDGTNSWTTAGGDFVSSPTATASVVWTGVVDTDTWNVTSDVQAFVSGTATNYGWLLKDQTEDNTQQWWTFATKENGTHADRPKLTVTYTPPPGAAAAIALTSGNNQSGAISTALANPFVVMVAEASHADGFIEKQSMKSELLALIQQELKFLRSSHAHFTAAKFEEREVV